MQRILVNGAGGFVGGHLVKRLKAEGHWVRGVDLKRHEFGQLPADEFIALDEALDRLEKVDVRAAEVVKLCFFVGLTHEQAAKELGVSISTVTLSLTVTCIVCSTWTGDGKGDRARPGTLCVSTE